MYTGTHSRKPIHTHRHTCMQARTHAHIHEQNAAPQRPNYTGTHALCAHTHMDALTHHANMHPRVCTQAHTHANPYIHTDTHACKHAHMHTYIHTQKTFHASIKTCTRAHTPIESEYDPAVHAWHVVAPAGRSVSREKPHHRSVQTEKSHRSVQTERSHRSVQTGVC